MWFSAEFLAKLLVGKQYANHMQRNAHLVGMQTKLFICIPLSVDLHVYYEFV